MRFYCGWVKRFPRLPHKQETASPTLVDATKINSHFSLKTLKVVDVGVEVEGLKNMNCRRFTMKKLFKTARGVINMEAILITVVLAAIAFVVLDVMFAGPMTTSNASVQALTGTDSGTTTGKTMMGLMYWLIPLGLGIALLITVLKARHED